MTRWIDWLNATSGVWIAWLWRITWQAAIVIVVAWLLTMLLRRTSPRLRSWIWRLAYLKLLVLMVWTTPVRLAVLPAAVGSGFGVQGSDIQEYKAAAVGRAETNTAIAAKSFNRDAQRSAGAMGNGEWGVGNKLQRSAEQAANPPGTAALIWQSYLLMAWLSGITLVVIWLAWEIARAEKLRRSVRIIQNVDVLTIVAEVCSQMRSRGTVRIGESQLAGGPMLVKFWTPIIVFPTGLVQSPSPQPSPLKGEGVPALSADELRLALAHELAHLKRHDLAWNALAAAVNVILYFHPLAWLAHRSSRQEQEMACDELVVTRLGVERHAYGQMLMKVVRRLGRNFPTGMAVVGMASSYQTLSQRIEAMKRFRPFTWRQITCAACGLALIGMLAIVPWQVVAQQPTVKSGDKSQQPADSPGVDESKATENSAKAQGLQSLGLPETKASSAAMEKLLIGTWRDSAGKEVVFQSDGTYQDFGVDIFVAVATGMNGDKEYKTTSRVRGGGNWKFEPDFLTLTFEPLARLWTGKADESSANLSREQESCRFTIMRLNKEYLRLKYTSDHGNETYFLSRDKEPPIDERFAAVPAELRPLFDAAQLTPDEAEALVQLCDAKKNDMSDLHIAARIQKARIQKITLQKLFGMTADEVNAFRVLLEQHQHSRQTFKELADGGQLLPVEKDAFEKTQLITQAFDNLATTIPRPSPKQFSVMQLSSAADNFVSPRFQRSGRGGRSGFGSAGPHQFQAARAQPPMANLTENQFAAVDKLFSYLYELEQWYRRAAFNYQW